MGLYYIIRIIGVTMFSKQKIIVNEKKLFRQCLLFYRAYLDSMYAQ